MGSGSASEARPLDSGADLDRGVVVRRDVGTGRSILIIDCRRSDSRESHHCTDSFIAAFSESLRVVELSVPPPRGAKEWGSVSQRIEELLAGLGIRYGAVLGVGEGSVIAQHLAITRPKICQSLIVVDPVFELSETFLGRFVARVESVLPLGLPLRIGGDQFASAPFLHRIRCPTLVVVSAQVGAASAREMESMARRIPNAWYQMLNATDDSVEFIELVRTFLPIRNRHPMRRAVG